MRKLPIFEGWIVDCRLREFRAETWADALDENVIPFDSDKGELMLCDYIASLDKNSPEFKNIADAIL